MLNTQATIEIINQLVAEKLIAEYVIGGAMGALFYLEPAQTNDIDVFIHLEPSGGSSLVSLDPLLKRLSELGYTEWEEDKIVVEGWPLQFVPVAKPIEVDALKSKTVHQISGKLITFTPAPEYLMAMALDLGRPKDKIRLNEFLQRNVADPKRFQVIVKKHSLEKKWEQFKILFEISDKEEG